MDKFDYSIHYRRFHDNTPEHAEAMVSGLAGFISPRLKLPSDTPILDIGCGFGFALGALKLLGYGNTLGLEASAEQAEACLM